MIRIVVSTLAALLLCQTALADAPKINQARAKFNYQMFCQGCHTPDGVGGRGVPKIQGFIGTFLNSQRGREYLVRVPGSANSVLDNPQLAELLNWTILEYGGASIPAQWNPYQADEVGEYRQNPLLEVLNYRTSLVAELTSASHPTPESEQP